MFDFVQEYQYRSPYNFCHVCIIPLGKGFNLSISLRIQQYCIHNHNTKIVLRTQKYGFLM